MRKISLTGLSVLFVSMLLFTGCGLKTSEYNISADNVVELKNLKDVKIAVDDFTSVNKDENQILCRLAETITTPKGESFSKYIENALKSELKMAGIYDKNSELKLSGKLIKIYGSSMLGNAYWEIEVKILSNNGKELSVRTKREYPSAFVGFTACNNMATSFSPTVRNLVNDIIKHEDFISLLN